jgi:hypothetical protein
VGAWKGAGSISQRSAAHLAGSTTKIEPVEADARAKGGRTAAIGRAHSPPSNAPPPPRYPPASGVCHG